jgi:OOP family OmpA-OmpF porin
MQQQFRSAYHAVIVVLTCGLLACAGAPDQAREMVPGTVSDYPDPAAGPSAATTGGGSDAEAPEEVVPAIQIAYALVPPDPKGLTPGEGSEEYRIDLPTITFKFESARLTSQGRAQLDQLAKALKYDSAALYRFRLAGHTDTAGPSEFNEALSWARAEAARTYLVERGDVDPARIEVQGHGERVLAWPTEDNVPQWRNRRVEVINLGPAS